MSHKKQDVHDRKMDGQPDELTTQLETIGSLMSDNGSSKIDTVSSYTEVNIRNVAAQMIYKVLQKTVMRDLELQIMYI